MEWLSVDSKLPDEGKKVLVCFYPKHPVMEGRLIGIDYRTVYSPRMAMRAQDYERHFDPNGFRLGAVTHWTPLPELPKIISHD